MTKTAATLGANAKSAIVDGLNQSLADTVVTTMMAQNYHWNVKGMSFGPLHTLFQEIYEDHFVGQDDLAERVKALGGHAEGTLAGHLKRTKVTETEGNLSDTEMLKALAAAQETLAQTVGEAGATAAEHDDLLTEDLCIARGTVHEKFAWMLRSHLG